MDLRLEIDSYVISRQGDRLPSVLGFSLKDNPAVVQRVPRGREVISEQEAAVVTDIVREFLRSSSNGQRTGYATISLQRQEEAGPETRVDDTIWETVGERDRLQAIEGASAQWQGGEEAFPPGQVIVVNGVFQTQETTQGTGPPRAEEPRVNPPTRGMVHRRNVQTDRRERLPRRNKENHDPTVPQPQFVTFIW